MVNITETQRRSWSIMVTHIERELPCEYDQDNDRDHYVIYSANTMAALLSLPHRDYEDFKVFLHGLQHPDTVRRNHPDLPISTNMLPSTFIKGFLRAVETIDDLYSRSLPKEALKLLVGLGSYSANEPDIGDNYYYYSNCYYYSMGKYRVIDMSTNDLNKITTVLEFIKTLPFETQKLIHDGVLRSHNLVYEDNPEQRLRGQYAYWARLLTWVRVKHNHSGVPSRRLAYLRNKKAKKGWYTNEWWTTGPGKWVP